MVDSSLKALWEMKRLHFWDSQREGLYLGLPKRGAVEWVSWVFVR